MELWVSSSLGVSFMEQVELVGLWFSKGLIYGSYGSLALSS